MQLIGIGTELKTGKVIKIEKTGVTVQNAKGVKTQLSLKEAENEIRSLLQAE